MRSHSRRDRYAMLGGLLVAMSLLPVACAPEHSDRGMSAHANAPTAANDPSGDAGYRQAVTAAIPGLASDDLMARTQAQREFEGVCMRAARPGAESHRVALCNAIVAQTSADTPLAARVWLVRKLENIGGKECVARLAELLHDGEIQIRDAARRALANNQTPAATAALESALRTTPAADAEWRAALVNALRGRGLTAEQSELIWQICKEQNVAGLAAISLGYSMEINLRGSTAHGLDERLSNFKAESNPQRREVIAGALLRAADVLRVQKSGASDAQAIYRAIAAADVNHATQVAALRGAAPDNSKRLFEIMLGDDAAFAAEAAAIAIDQPSLAGELVNRLGDFPAPIQAEIVENLADRKSPSGLAAALKAWSSNDDELRIAATRAVGVLGSAAELQRLIERAATTKGAERDAARWSLARLPGRDTDAQLTRRIGEGEAGQRAETIRAVGARNLKSALPNVMTAASNDNEDVRVAACNVLGDMATSNELPVLVERLVADSGDRSGPAAEDAVVAVANRTLDAEHRAAPVLAKLDAAPASGRPALIRALGRLGGDAALVQIRKSLASGGDAERDAAVRALAKWTDAAVLPDLEQIVKSTTDETHRSLALRGYFRLLKTQTDKTPDQRMELVQRVLASARSVEDRKAMLGTLGEIRHPEALALASSSLNEEGLRDEAALATASAARRLAADQPQAVKAALEKAQAANVGENAKKGVTEALEFLSKFAGYVAGWQYAGPYFQDGKEFRWVYDTAFDAENPAANDVKWRPLPPSNNANPFILDLTQIDKGSNRCLYARSWVWSEKKQPARLETGSDDGIRVWLNGESIYGKPGQRSLTQSEDKIAVNLEEGWNLIVLKIIQSGGNWEFCCGVRGPNGEELNGLKFKAEP